MALSPGKIRHFQQISNCRGIFTILAVDHREPMIQMIEQREGAKPDWQQVAQEKQRLVEALAQHTSGVLLDPIYSVGPIVANCALPREVGLLVAREKSGYLAQSDGTRTNTLLPDWDAAVTKRIGGAAVKLLLYYHPQAANSGFQEEIVHQIAQECRKNDIVFMLEPISYPLQEGQSKNSPEFARQRPDIVLESARKLAPLGVDILKAEFPSDPVHEKDEQQMRNYCRRLTQTIAIPWVLLSAGVDFPMFQRQVEIACEEGASGFVAGRAIWKEAVSSSQMSTRDHYLHAIAVSRLQILAAIANCRGCPWQKRLPEFPQFQEGWHRDYANYSPSQ